MTQVTSGISIDRSGWTGATLTIIATTFPLRTATWSFSTQIGGDTANHYDVMADIESWANSGSRPWTGIFTFSWRFTGQSPRYGTQLTASPIAVSDYTTSSAMQTMMAWPSSTGAAASITSTAGLNGTCDAAFRVPGWVPRVDGTGIHAGQGAALPDAPSSALHWTALEAALTEDQALALRAALASGPSTRHCRVYHPAADAWRYISLGQVSLDRGDIDLYRAQLEGVG